MVGSAVMKSVLFKVSRTCICPLVDSSVSVFAPFKKNHISVVEEVPNNFTGKLL